MSRSMQKGSFCFLALLGALFGSVNGTTAELTLTESQMLLASDAASADWFGYSVAVDGDTAVIGARLEDSGRYSASGAAYVFTRNDSGVWAEEAKLLANDPRTGDVFGTSVAVSGDTVVIGASLKSSGAVQNGAAYVFTRDAGGAWSQQAKLVAGDAQNFDRFGVSVAVAGDTAVVGAEREDNGGSDSGAAYVFTRNADGAWSQQAKLVAGDAQSLDLFGGSVAAAGDTTVIGARLGDSAGPESGAAYVFVRDASGAWSQQAKLVAGDAQGFDEFGVSVAVTGDTAVVGAHREDSRGSDSGAAYVFVRDGSGIWWQQTKLTASDAAKKDNFGGAVAAAGDTAVIGALFEDSGAAAENGAAYVFTRDGNAVWSESAKLLASDAANFDNFGRAVGVTRGAAVIGAYLNDDHGTSSGAAYVFDLVSDDEGPVTTNVVAIPEPVRVDTTMTLTAHIDDATTGGSDIASVAYSVDGGAAVSMAAQDGGLDEISEDVTAGIPGFGEAGMHELCVSGTDSAGNAGAGACVFLAVYDPDAGAVTGGGWFHSPAGAYVADPALAGKASIAFVSRYLQGNEAPSGSTEFRFRAADLNFRSVNDAWLVIAGHRARYRGVGTINGAGNYGFMLSATDANLTDATDTDLIRIRIWDRDNGNAIVYDSEPGSAGSAEPTMPIGGGSIVIETRGSNASAAGTKRNSGSKNRSGNGFP